MKFRRDALLGLERCAGDVVTDILNVIETCDPEEDPQMRLLIREFPSFADLYHQIADADPAYARQCMDHWILFLDGPPNNPNDDEYGLLQMTLHFFKSLGGIAGTGAGIGAAVQSLTATASVAHAPPTIAAIAGADIVEDFGLGGEVHMIEPDDSYEYDDDEDEGAYSFNLTLVSATSMASSSSASSASSASASSSTTTASVAARATSATTAATTTTTAAASAAAVVTRVNESVSAECFGPHDSTEKDLLDSSMGESLFSDRYNNDLTCFGL